MLLPLFFYQHTSNLKITFGLEVVNSDIQQHMKMIAYSCRYREHLEFLPSCLVQILKSIQLHSFGITQVHPRMCKKVYSQMRNQMDMSSQ